MGPLKIERSQTEAQESDAVPAGSRQSLTWTDLVGLVVAFGACVGSISATTIPAWTPRLATMLVGLPVGLMLLVRLIRRRDPAGMVLGAAALWLLVSLLFHTAPFLRMFGRYGMEASVLIYVAGIAIWAIGRHMSDDGLRILPWIVAAGLGLSGLVGLFQVLLEIESGPFALSGNRAHGLSRYSVYFGAMMTAGVVLAAAWRPPRRFIGLQLLAVTFFATAAGLSGSRAAVLGSLGAAGYLLAVRRTPAALGPLLAALGGTVLGSVLVSHRLGDVSGDADGGAVLDRFGVTGDGAGGIGWRLDGWFAGFEAWIDRPVVGWGVGNFRQAVSTRLPGFDVDRTPRFDAHNIIVEIAVATGIVGLAILAAFVVLSVRSARGPLAVAAAAMAATWLLQPADTGTLGLSMLFVGAAWRPRQLEVEGVTPPPRVVAIAALIGLVAGSTFLVGDLRLKRATDELDTATLESFARVVWFDPVLADFAAQASSNEWIASGLEAEWARNTIDWSRRAVERQPDAPVWLDRLGTYHVVFDEWPEARAVLEQALEMQPDRPSTLEAMQYLARQSSDDELLEEVTARLCHLDEDVCTE